MGTSATVLSAVNSGGRNLGYNLGGRLATELGVSLLELGAPLAAVDAKGETLIDRLEGLAEKVAYLLDREATLTKELGDVRTHLVRLEKERKPHRAVPKHQEPHSI